MKEQQENVASNWAQRGETLRVQGIYSESIKCFDEALKLDPNYAWAYAHRGAAKGALQDLKGALDDFNAAFELKPDYPWVLGQMGEVYRTYARDNLWETPEGAARGNVLPILHKEAPSWISKSIDAFDKAVAGMPRSAWTHAHRGAAHTLAYIVKERIQGEDASEHAKKALDDFDRTLELTPVYPWAQAFKAMLLGLMRQYAEARKVLGDSLLYDIGQRLDVLRAFSMLFNYNGEIAESVTAGWQALQFSADDFTARYMVSVGLAKLGDPTAAASVRQSRVQLTNIAARATALLGGLALAEGNKKEAIRALEEIRKHPDVETYMIINLDTTWEPLRSDPEYSWLFKPPTVAESARRGEAA